MTTYLRRRVPVSRRYVASRQDALRVKCAFCNAHPGAACVNLPSGKQAKEPHTVRQLVAKGRVVWGW